jgi:hypothetical protein
MNYVITNAQLLTLMLDYLDNLRESRLGSIITIYRGDYVDYNIVMNITSNKILYISKSFLETFSMMFPLDFEDSVEFIVDWFEHKFDDVHIKEIVYF